MNPPNPFGPEGREVYLRARRKALKSAFSGRINGNFMLETCERVIKALSVPGEMEKYFPNFLPNDANMVTGEADQVDYEVCRYVVGAHRSNMAFVGDADRAKAEANGEYRDELFDQVLTNIRLRNYAGAFFRKKPIVPGDEFLFFNLPHDLFAISVNAGSLLKGSGDYAKFYASIFNKALVALSLVGDNFLAGAYPICRSIIEVYLKLLVLECRPVALCEHDIFTDYDFHRNLTEAGWPEEFTRKFGNRKWKHCRVKGDYLHFGWVDSIPDYFDGVVKSYPYSVSGLAEFLLRLYGSGQKTLFGNLLDGYSICNAYAHGNLMNCNYPLNDYFQLTFILSLTVPDTYKMLCEDEKADAQINGLDIVAKTNADIQRMVEQYKMRSTENFNAYYNRR